MPKKSIKVRPYTKTAPYFNMLMGTKRVKEECDDLIKEFNDNTIKILDFGCGTGLHSIELAKRGYDVTGIDINQEMLDIAIENAKKENVSVDFKCIDILEWYTNRKFDACISMWNVIGYIDGWNNLKRVFDKIGSMLWYKGVFVFDCFNGIAVIDLKPHKTIKFKSKDNLVVNRSGVPTVSNLKQTLDMDYHYIIFDGKSIEKYDEKHQMNFYTPIQLINLLPNCGFYVSNVTNVIDGKRVLDDDWDIRYICTKMF